jgi:hypothetical protein
MRAARITKTINRKLEDIVELEKPVSELRRVYDLSGNLSRGKAGEFGEFCKQQNFIVSILPKQKIFINLLFESDKLELSLLKILPIIFI